MLGSHQLCYLLNLLQRSLNGVTNDQLIRQVATDFPPRATVCQLAESVCSVLPANYTGCVGRPRFIIPREQLRHLIEAHFSVPHIVHMIGVSPRTVRRRMTEHCR